MNPKEQEIAINELEERVDRLRNIYEQYFLGFEKLEPTVPKKDVDRRFALLRKEQIRNTAMRFRFQVVTQKFNTYAMHWVRICRQIEEGTYKRHIRKAKARFGDGRPDVVEREITIDIDMDEFETDIDMVDLVSATVASAARDDSADTDRPPPPPSARGAVAPERTARGAPLPAGAKPRILRKRDDGAELPQSARMPVASPPPQTHLPMPMPNTPTPRAGIPAAGRILAAAPVPAAPGSSPRMPIAPIVGPPLPGAGAKPLPPGAGAKPPPALAPPSERRMPVLPPPSERRMPVPPFPPAPFPPAPSAGRMPVAPPADPPRRPAPPSAGMPGAASSGNQPARPPLRPIQPKARPPMPSVSDNSDTVPPPPTEPQPRPSVRPRPALPLPSQAARVPKKE